MVGGVLTIIGLIATFVVVMELILRPLERRKRELEAAIVRHRLYGYPPPSSVDGAPCPWPRLEPEVERLREKGAL